MLLRLNPGDTITIKSSTDDTINSPAITILAALDDGELMFRTFNDPTRLGVDDDVDNG